MGGRGWSFSKILGWDTLPAANPEQNFENLSSEIQKRKFLLAFSEKSG